MASFLRERALVWFRRDLRPNDHAALAAAAREARRLHVAFVFDTDILDELADRNDRRVSFIHASLAELDRKLGAAGGLAPGRAVIEVVHGRAATEIPRLAAVLGAEAVYVNRDVEPAAKARDASVARALEQDGRRFVSCRDTVVFEADELLTQAGRPYTVYTPYRRAWEKRLAETGGEALHEQVVRLVPGQLQAADGGLRPLAEYGFTAADLGGSLLQAGESGARAALEAFAARLADYAEARDFPARTGTSGLSPHLRFGTLSVREAARTAQAAIDAGMAADGARAWLGELIWRDFFFAILDRFPHSAERNFKPVFDRVRWRDEGSEAAGDYAAWCAGKTGYPLIDAGLRELVTTGRMHNRVRMVAAAFLCKHLGIHWRAGERFFARHLLDYDLAANAGNWQWAASTGCDAQPWFRIFNPVTQSQRFDPHGDYIRRFVPELSALGARDVHAPWMLPPARRPAGYPLPIIEHAAGREAALARFALLRGPA